MSIATITFSASMVADGETKTIGSTATLSVQSITTGKQTIGSTYEAAAIPFPTNALVIIYNPSANDVAIRIETVISSSSEYFFYNLIPGGIFVVPRWHLSDVTALIAPSQINRLSAKTDKGTADLEYCIIK
jgi:hypothetical protein